MYQFYTKFKPIVIIVVVASFEFITCQNKTQQKKKESPFTRASKFEMNSNTKRQSASATFSQFQ